MIYVVLKHSGLILGLFLVLIASSLSAQETDTASVKIKVDVPGVRVLVNGDSLLVDSYGNQLLANAWFVLNLSAGQYLLNFHHPDYESQTRELILKRDEIATIEIRFLPIETVPEEDSTVASGSSQVSVHSNPIEASISLDGKMLTEETPSDIGINSGSHQIEVLLDGWEPLSHTFEIKNSDPIILNYILMPTAPPSSLPDALGLEYHKKLIPLDVRRANHLKITFNSLTETFAILPLGQGIIAKVFLRGDQEKTANGLIISGVILSGGSYILGKILYRRKINNINTRNSEIKLSNIEADEHNRTVDQALKEHDDILLESWLNENKGKGKVEVEILPDSLMALPPY